MDAHSKYVKLLHNDVRIHRNKPYEPKLHASLNAQFQHAATYRLEK